MINDTHYIIYNTNINVLTYLHQLHFNLLVKNIRLLEIESELQYSHQIKLWHDMIKASFAPAGLIWFIFDNKQKADTLSGLMNAKEHIVEGPLYSDAKDAGEINN